MSKDSLSTSDDENMLAALVPSGIELQESQGQRALVTSELLPGTFNSGSRKDLEKLGVKFGEPDGDIFVKCTLPEGWKKISTGHSMWSELRNDKDEVVASIFFKAAFYDRSAFISIEEKYQIK